MRLKFSIVKEVRILLLIYMFLFPRELICQSLRYPLSTGHSRVGVYSKNFIDPLSCKHNPASLGNMRSAGAAVYGEQRFALQELALYQAAICIPVGFGGVGISATSFGFKDYKETQLGIAFGKSLGNIDIGIQISSQSIQVSGYGSDALFTVEAGMIIHLSEQLHAGIHAFNPTGSKFGVDHVEKLSPVFSAGLGFEPSKIFFLGGELIKETGRPININIGMQYVFSKRVLLRVGVYSESPTFYFGPGVKWRSLHLGVTVSYHPQLGVTPGILLVFEGKGDKE